MENNQNQTPENEKIGFFTKAKTKITSGLEKIPAPVKKVAKIGAIVGGTVIATAIFGKHFDLDTDIDDDETTDPEDKKEEEKPFE